MSLHGVAAVVLGASAGGVEALLQLLPAVPAHAQVAVFVVLHLPPDRRSLLTQIFTPVCALAVKEAEDKEPIVPGTIYLAPPDYHLLVDRGPQIVLSVDAPEQFSRPSIDTLFETAADLYRDRLLGIVLSGNSDDGAAGLAAVARAGGRTVVQDPAQARGAMMPAEALLRVPGARVLSLPQIADLLRSLPAAGTP